MNVEMIIVLFQMFNWQKISRIIYLVSARNYRIRFNIFNFLLTVNLQHYYWFTKVTISFIFVLSPEIKIINNRGSTLTKLDQIQFSLRFWKVSTGFFPECGAGRHNSNSQKYCLKNSKQNFPVSTFFKSKFIKTPQNHYFSKQKIIILSTKI